jgi:hypothetical protein
MRASWCVLAILVACGEEAHVDPPVSLPGDPGRVTARRLNRVEYDNTVRDLLGSKLAPARNFPTDDRAFGFDNIADALHVSPAHVELLEQSTFALVDELLAARDDATVRERVLVCDEPERACIEQIVEHFAPRAWRRPLDADEHETLLSVYDVAIGRGARYDDALAAVLATVLLSPSFLFRIERDADEPGPHRLDDYELASRLSYFLWSSMPDDALFDVAAANTLHHPKVLEREVRRMLADPRAHALVTDFAGQWLAIRGISDLLKDAYRYPDWDPALAASMRTELELFVANMIEEGRPIEDLLVASDGWVDARLAEHYGIAAPSETEFVHIDWGTIKRRGVLTSGGLMSVLAYPFTTSPARRGKFVLEQLLCRPAGAPPDGVEIEAPTPQEAKREASAERLADPRCAPCHAQMDPMGMAFEQYDATGRFRTVELDETIDPAGALPSGERFADALELGQIVADDPGFARCVVKHTLGYALGRGIASDDEVWIDEISEHFDEHGHDTSELFVAVAMSGVFRHRSTEDR